MTAATDLIQIIQRISADTYNAQKPVQMTFGTVIQAPPEIRIKVNDKTILDSDLLVLTSAVTDHNIEITTDITTDAVPDSFLRHYHSTSEGDTGNKALPHTHEITKKHCITVHNALEVGDTVLLCRMQGGNAFIVLDAIKRARERKLS